MPKRSTKVSLRSSLFYKHGRFKLYKGNCLEILPKLKAESVDLVFADPPYNLSNDGFSVHAGKRVSVNKGQWDASKGVEADMEFHLAWIQAVQRVLKPNGTIWISGTYHSIYQCGYALQQLGFHILNDIAWFKPNASPNLSCRVFTASHETLLWARKSKKAKHYFNYQAMKHFDQVKADGTPADQLKKAGKQMRSVWSIPSPKHAEKHFGKHPTQKPFALLERIVLASVSQQQNEGGVRTILDPFTGSSTTGLAATKYGHEYIGIDQERKYLELSKKRYLEFRKQGKNFGKGGSR